MAKLGIRTILLGGISLKTGKIIFCLMGPQEGSMGAKGNMKTSRRECNGKELEEEEAKGQFFIVSVMQTY